MQSEKANIDNTFIRKVWITVGIVSLSVIMLLLFRTLFSVILFLLAGILMAIYFHGCASLFEKWFHLNSKIAIIISVLLNFIILGLFFWFVGARLQQQISELADTLPSTIENAEGWLTKYPAGQRAVDFLGTSGDSGKALSTVKTFFSSTFGILSDTYIILLLGLFFTASPTTYRKGVISLLPTAAKKEGRDLLDEIHQVLKAWIKGMLFGFLFIGVLSGIGLWIIGMPLVLTLALIAGLMNFIPNFGPIIALVPAILIALTQDVTTAIIVACIYTGIQIFQSAVTDPIIQKKMTSLPPALVIVGQVGMGILAGFWGVLLATPILVIISITIKRLYISRQKETAESEA